MNRKAMASDGVSGSATLAVEDEAPQCVHIGGIEYLVVEHDPLREGDERIDGQFCHTESEIRLDAGLGEQARRVTLWHEIIHGCLVHAGYTNEHDEQMVAALAYSVMQVVRDNPWLARQGAVDDDV